MSDDVKALIARLRKYLQAREEVTPQIAGQVFDTVVDLDMGSRGHVRLLASDIALAADALEAAQQAPAVNRETLSVQIARNVGHWAIRVPGAENISGHELFRELAGAVIAAGILKDAAEVEARGLEKAADIAEHPTWHPLGRLNDAEQTVSIRIAHAVRSCAQRVREGNA